MAKSNLRFIRICSRSILLLLVVLLSAVQCLLAQSTVTTLTLSADEVPHGTAVTLTATVTNGGAGVAPGAVTFCRADVKYCEAPFIFGTAQLRPDGTASIKLIPGIGTYAIQAVFAGTNRYAASTSAAQNLTVTGTYPTTTTLVSSQSGNNLNLTATVTGYGNLPVGPTGSISFLDASNNNAVLGTATLGSSTLSLGFSAPVQYPIGAESVSINVVDLNNDGIPDLVIGNAASSTMSILLGNGDGTFRQGVNNLPSRSFALGDFNGDGNLDIAIFAPGGTSITVFEGNGDGTFQNPVATPTSNSGWLVAGDFNRDGNLDLAMLDSTTFTLIVFPGNGDGKFGTALTSSIPVPQSSAAVSIGGGDFNGDGKPDLLIGNYVTNTGSSVLVLSGNGDGTFQAPVSSLYGTSQFAPWPVVADFNGDGIPDLAFGNGIMLGNGDGTFQPLIAFPNQLSGDSVAAGDFNSDGKLDIAVAVLGLNDPAAGLGMAPNIYLLPGDGDGTFQGQPAMYTSGSNAAALAVGDFNGDGQPDIAAMNTNDGTIKLPGWVAGTVSILLNQVAQTATASVQATLPTGAGTHQVVASYPGDTLYSSSASTPLSIVAPSFALGANANTLTLQRGQSGQLTIDLSPAGGFNGTVNLTCAVTTSISNQINPPTCSIPASINVSGTAAVTTAITIATTAATTNALVLPPGRFLLSGGSALTLVLFVGLPIRRRGWRRIWGILFIAIVLGAAGCSGGRSNNGGENTGNPGTTAGAYTVTVTGSDAATGKLTATTVITLTVS